MRRVHVNGLTTLMDYCTGPSFASGGFIADSQFDGSTVDQRLAAAVAGHGTARSTAGRTASGTRSSPASSGAPAAVLPGAPRAAARTRRSPTSPVTREAPYLYVDAAGDYNVFVPGRAARLGRHDVGERADARHVDPARRLLRRQARPTPRRRSTTRSRSGQNLLFTPGRLPRSTRRSRSSAPTRSCSASASPTLVPTNGVVADDGRRRRRASKLAGLIFDAGPVNSPVLLQVGTPARATRATPADPTALQDVFFRIGGAARRARRRRASSSTATTSILDDIWAWRADHGNGVGWTVNTADTGVVVNGDNVTAYGLFVEHYQKYEVIWNGERRHGRLLPERDALRPAEPGGVDGGARRPTAGPRSRSPTA